MKTKLTLRLDDGLKERAKQLAEQRGTSVSKIVEDYFRMLLREDLAGSTKRKSRIRPSASNLNTLPDDLPPRTRRMLRGIKPAAGPLDVDDDTRAWIDAAHVKHA